MQPAALMIDDSQWLDEAGAAVLDALAGAVQTLPVLLVVARRTGTGPDLGPQAAEPMMRLAGLDAATLAELAARQLRSPLDSLAGELANAIAQGNPLVLMQVLDALDASGRLIRQGGRVRLSPETLDALRAGQALVSGESGRRFAESQLEIGSILGLPDSLHGLMPARVDRLPEAAKLTLKLAGVVGRVFDVELPAHAHPLGAPLAAIDEDIALLARQGLIMAQGERAGVAYRFEHNLAHELVYQTLLSTQQQELHGRVGRALEILESDSVVTPAHHFAAADTSQPDLRGKALIYLDQAVTRLRADYANETALRFLAQALSLEVRPDTQRDHTRRWGRGGK